jgi:hypothetical protein
MSEATMKNLEDLRWEARHSDPDEGINTYIGVNLESLYFT